MIKLLLFIFLSLFLLSCQAQTTNTSLKLGCERTEVYLPLLKGKNVGLLVNHTSMVGNTHLIDTLLSSGIEVTKIFAPEHGFRGTADAGEHIKDGKDAKTGLPIVSLYGKHKKPTQNDLKEMDVIIFDIQDVGVRFYTYISSMHYMMEACAENGVQMMVLDRPNPNGDYFDGPVLDTTFRSFVGMHPIPVVHGLTVGELAQMINGEKWLNEGRSCDLHIINMENYRHDMPYDLPVKPSPNLPNAISVRLYPSLCFFEATKVSAGRGTYMPFQVAGYPDPKFGDFTFTPVSIKGMATKPLQQDQLCYGIDLRKEPLTHRFTLKYFFDFYNKSGASPDFVSRRRWFNLLAGTDQLLQQIEQGLSEKEIRDSWKPALDKYKSMRAKYLLYQ